MKNVDAAAKAAIAPLFPECAPNEYQGAAVE